MARLIINRVLYSGKKYRFESPELRNGINIFAGENGAGKTTFAEMIFFGLGGKSELFQRESENRLKEIAEDVDNYIELEVTIKNSKYRLRRFVDSNDIAVMISEKEVNVYSVNRSKDSKFIFSDWLLQQLDIEPVNLFLGTESWKINFADLMRLIYHDQMLDPNRIYKSPSAENYIQDSKVMRKAIFEILVGKTFSEYYLAFGQYKELEKQKNYLEGALDNFVNAINQLEIQGEDLNVFFLEKKINEAQDRLKKLQAHRKQLSKGVGLSKHKADPAANIKSDILNLEINSTELIEEKMRIYDELSKLRKLKTDSILEATQIKKMMFTQNELNLFSANVCPYCMNNVHRDKNKCVCGAEIGEEEYERYFYTGEEYQQILKVKQKSVDTIDIAISVSEIELENVKKSKELLEVEVSALKGKLGEIVMESDSAFDVAQFNNVDDEIVKLKSTVSSLQYQLTLEKKREDIQNKLTHVKSQFDKTKRETNRLYNEALSEMQGLVGEFSHKYDALMKSTVQHCKHTEIKEDYSPMFNNGEHLEASANVPKRLMYFFTLLYLSLEHQEISFPRFLLIDTPDTAGIDDDNLIGSISKIKDVVPKEEDWQNFQLILTTAVNKYPPAFEDRVFLKLEGESKLLIKRI